MPCVWYKGEFSSELQDIKTTENYKDQTIKYVWICHEKVKDRGHGSHWKAQKQKKERETDKNI